MDSEPATKVTTSCKDLAKVSYKCLEERQLKGNNVSCQEHFDNYRKCIKQEHDQIIEERRKKGAWLN